MLTHALFVPSVNKIYGVRGGMLFEFDANGVITGRSLPLADMPGPAQLALSPSGDLWASQACDAHNYERISQQGLYKINLAALTISQFVPYDGTFVFPNVIPQTVPGNQSDFYTSGPVGIKFAPDGTLFCMTLSQNNAGMAISQLAANFATVVTWEGNFGDAPNAFQFYYDSVADLLWIGNYQTRLEMLARVPSPPGPDGLTNFAPGAFFDYGSSAFAFYGFDYVPAVDQFFISTRTPKLMLFNKTTHAFTLKDLSASRPNMAPRMARFVSYKNRIYLPTMQDNAVVEVDTAGTVTNVFTLPTGSVPWDIVDTGAKVFAVCLGKTGLIQVTT